MIEASEAAAERQTIWDMREAGVPVKRITKHFVNRPGIGDCSFP